MRIAVTGAQCTGKSTLINALKNELPNYSVQRESVRYLVNTYDFDITSADPSFQLALLNLQTKSLLSHTDILLDRTFIDSTAYMMYYHKRNSPSVPWSAYQFILDSSLELSKNLDLIIFLKPEFELVEDGFRLVDKKQQEEVTNTMELLINFFDVEDRTLYVAGDIYQRVKQVLKEIK